MRAITDHSEGTNWVIAVQLENKESSGVLKTGLGVSLLRNKKSYSLVGIIIYNPPGVSWLILYLRILDCNNRVPLARSRLHLHLVLLDIPGLRYILGTSL